jgi:hypothetical protein
MVTKKPPAITHSARIPVPLSQRIQKDADEKSGGNFSQQLVKMIEYYYKRLEELNKKKKKK